MAEPVHQTDVEMILMLLFWWNRGALESVGGTLFQIFPGRRLYRRLYDGKSLLDEFVSLIEGKL